MSEEIVYYGSDDNVKPLSFRNSGILSLDVSRNSAEPPMSTENSSALTIRNACKGYGAGSSLVLSNLNVTIQKGVM